jgi:hypothetical protein
MNLSSVNVAAPAISGAPSMDGNAIIDLAEVRAARGRTAAAAAAARMTRENVFEGLERQAWMVGAAAELMISGMNRFIDELEVLRRDVAVAREFCTACQDACELDDIDAMIEARDRLRAEFDERVSGARQPAAE